MGSGNHMGSWGRILGHLFAEKCSICTIWSVLFLQLYNNGWDYGLLRLWSSWALHNFPALGISLAAAIIVLLYYNFCASLFSASKHGSHQKLSFTKIKYPERNVAWSHIETANDLKLVIDTFFWQVPLYPSSTPNWEYFAGLQCISSSARACFIGMVVL